MEISMLRHGISLDIAMSAIVLNKMYFKIALLLIIL